MATFMTCPRGHPLAPSDSRCPVCGVMVLTEAEGQATAAIAETAGDASMPLPTIEGYELLQELGRGGMGVVYKALQKNLGRVVALKMVLAGQFASSRQIERMLGEARALARFQHPHIVQIHAVGQFQGNLCLALEFVSGGNLARHIAGKPQPPREAAALVESLARAIETAHQQGIIHRDLKPANILLTAEGTPKISDFGLAKNLEEDLSRTETGAIMGTPSYMAPEQAGGKSKINPQDRPVDIYALGAILYELLTGRPPFLGQTTADTLQQVLDADPVPPHRLQPKVPTDLETICLKCLEKVPSQRYPSAQALADDLHRFLHHQPIKARPTGVVRRLGKWCRRHPAQVTVLVAAVLVMLGLGLWQGEVYIRRQTEERELAKLQHENDQDLAIFKSQLADAQFASAQLTLQRADERLQKEEQRLADRQASWERLRRLLFFWTSAENAWFRAGEERYVEGQQAGEEALQALGILTDQGRFTPQWWALLPTGDLPERQAELVEQEAYRMLLLLTYLRTVPWLNPRDWRAPAALAGYGSALAAVDQAQAHEDSGRVPHSQTVILFGKILRDLLGQKSALPPVPVAAAKGDDYRKAIDHFFVGSVHYFVAGAPPKSLLPVIIRKSLGKHLEGQDTLGLLQTTEERLREAVRLDPKMFWPQFVLGRTLLNVGKCGEAELAFNTCVALRPDYPVSYQFRALAISRSAQLLETTQARRRQQMLQRAREDSAQALKLAQQSDNPAIFWARGDMYIILNDAPAALDAFAAGLEQEYQLEKKMFRSNVLDKVEQFAAKVLQGEPQNADAQVTQALVHLTRGQTKQAQEAIQKALQVAPKHPRALRLREKLPLS